jgi:hypothetical protein
MQSNSVNEINFLSFDGFFSPLIEVFSVSILYDITALCWLDLTIPE